MSIECPFKVGDIVVSLFHSVELRYNEKVLVKKVDFSTPGALHPTYLIFHNKHGTYHHNQFRRATDAEIADALEESTRLTEPKESPMISTDVLDELIHLYETLATRNERLPALKKLKDDIERLT